MRKMTQIYWILFSVLLFSQQALAACQSRFFSRGRQVTFNSCRGNGVGVNRFAGVRGAFGSDVQFSRDAKEIAGFNKLLNLNGKIIIQDASGGQFRVFVDRFGNLIDQFGRRVSEREPEAVRQLRRFYQLNRAKFANNANARNIVDRFLTANGGFGNGRVTIDLASFSLDSGADDMNGVTDAATGQSVDRIGAGLAALNFALNSAQTRCLVKILPNQVDRVRGTVSLDLTRFRDRNGNLCFNGDLLSIMQDADASAQCNGGKLRANHVIHTLMDPNNYYRGLGVDNLSRQGVTDRQAIAAVFGITEDKRFAPPGSKILVGTGPDGQGESGVASGDHRVLEFQRTANVPGRACFRSYDFIDINSPGVEVNSRSVTKNGILFDHEAEEWLCLGANGFMMGFLFNKDGKLINRAPAEIASGTPTIGPSVSAAAACLDCHKDGFIGGGNRFKDPTRQYTEQLGNIPNTPTIFRDQLGNQLRHRDFFTSNANYKAFSDPFGKDVFQKAQELAGARLMKGGESIPLIPQAIRAESKAVTPEIAARELATSVEEARKLMGQAGMSRGDFDQRFCNMKRGVSAPLSEGQEGVLIRREQAKGRAQLLQSHTIDVQAPRRQR